MRRSAAYLTTIFNRLNRKRESVHKSTRARTSLDWKSLVTEKKTLVASSGVKPSLLAVIKYKI